MAKVKKQVKTVDKWKKKRWFTLVAPEIFAEKVLGETPSNDPDLLIGRPVSANLMSLTGNVKRQNIDVEFEVVKVQGDKAYTQVKKFELASSFVKRRVRRGKDRIDLSFLCLTKDNKLIRIKPMVITTSNTSKLTQNELRASIIENIMKTVRILTYDTLINDLVSYKFQHALKNVLHKIHPIAAAEVRSMMAVEDEKALASLKSSLKEPAKEPAKETAEKPEEAAA